MMNSGDPFIDMAHWDTYYTHEKVRRLNQVEYSIKKNIRVLNIESPRHKQSLTVHTHTHIRMLT